MIVLDLANVDPKHASRPKASLFGVFDGHGGREVAHFAAAHLPETITTTPAYDTGNVTDALREAFLGLDILLVQEEHKTELKALKGEDDDDNGTGSGGMTINSSQLPEALLDALGVSGESGYVFRIVKAPNGQMRITGDGEEDGDEDDEEGNAITEIVPDDQQQQADNKQLIATFPPSDVVSPFADIADDSKSGDEDDEREDSRSLAANGKRKRGVAGDMEVDETGGGDDFQPGREMVIEELNREQEEEWHGPSAGCTAVCAMVRDGEIVVANAGDSRCVLSRNGEAVAMTQDHKPMDAGEYDRIIKAGGFVADGRVNGSLNLSRALGDLEYKQTKELPPEAQMVTADPEIRTEKYQPADEFFILACDGIWDVLTNQEAVDFVRERLLAGKTPQEICEEACDHCLAPDTNGCGKGCDNMSIIIVVFKESSLAARAAEARKKVAAAAAAPNA